MKLVDVAPGLLGVYRKDCYILVYWALGLEDRDGEALISVGSIPRVFSNILSVYLPLDSEVYWASLL